MLVSRRRRLSRVRTLRLLDEVEASSGPAVSLYTPAGLSSADVEKAVTTALGIRYDEIPHEVIEAVRSSKTGAVLFWGDTEKCIAMPPFPIGERLLSSGYDTKPLRLLLQQELIVALILLRLGAYAIGVFRGTKLLASKVGTGLVHARHRQGGSSERRFARHREKQMEYFFERVCAHVRERLEPHERDMDYVVYGGERHTLLAFRRQCEYLSLFDDRTQDRLLNVRDPKQASLEAAIEQVWCSEVIDWREGEPEGNRSF